MTVAEIRAAINFGKESIEQYKAAGEPIPTWMVDRMVELYEQLVDALNVGE